MKYQRKLISVMIFLVFTSFFTVSCESEEEIKKLSNQINELQEDKNKLNSYKSDLESQVTNLQEKNDKLTENNEQLKQNVEDLQLNKNEIKFDIRIPLDVFKIIQIYSEGVNTNDVTKIEKTVIDKNSRAYKVAMQKMDAKKKMTLQQLRYDFERTYESSTKVTETSVVSVRYNDKKN